MKFLCCFSVKRNVRTAGFSKRNVRAAGFLKRNVRAAGFWRKSQNANFTPKFVQFRGDRIFKKLYTKKKTDIYDISLHFTRGETGSISKSNIHDE